jgi:putative ABC transport system permease protein
MFLNQLKTALRHLLRRRGHFAINLIGLAVAMAAGILILLHVQDDLGFERSHVAVDRIYRVFREFSQEEKTMRIALTPRPLASALKHDVTAVEDAASISPSRSAWVRRGEEWMRVEPVHYADPAFFRIFSFVIRRGSLTSALREPRTVVLTAARSRKIFGGEDPIGRTIHLRNIGDLRVAAVIEDPRQSHLRLGLILPAALIPMVPQQDLKSVSNSTTYILAGRYESEAGLRRKIAEYSKIYWGPDTSEVFRLQPLRRIWLHSDLAYDFLRAPYGIGLLSLLLSVACGILAMACINYVNIETARVSRRAAEAAIRKAFGARRWQLIAQFLGEACALSLMAFFLALILVEAVLPSFNRFTLIKDLRLFAPGNIHILLLLLGIALVTGLAAGAYPALVFASIQPAAVLRKIPSGFSGARMRKALVVGQFSVAVMLVIATLALAAQLRYLHNKDPGYDPKHLLCAEMPETIVKDFDAFKAELLKLPGIVSVTGARDMPTWRGPSFTMRDWEGKQSEEGFLIHHGFVDRSFVETMRLELLEGISFAEDESGSGLIVNQAAAERMGMTDPVGRRISGSLYKGRIIGVVKNYYYNSMREKIEPLVLKVSREHLHVLFIRTTPGPPPDTFALVQEAWRKFEKDLPADLVFLQNALDDIYKTEHKVTQLFSYGSIIAICIACLGLYGLSTFFAVQRAKEIAIRKSCGASKNAILKMLVAEYIKLLLVANLIAWPIAYFLVERWLDTFAQRVQLGWTLFFLAFATTAAIVLTTVSYQALKTASANPAVALRYE